VPMPLRLAMLVSGYGEYMARAAAASSVVGTGRRTRSLPTAFGRDDGATVGDRPHVTRV
jgi:hypothetical protein